MFVESFGRLVLLPVGLLNPSMNFTLETALAEDTTGTHSGTFDQVLSMLWLLIVIAIVAVVTKYIKLPYTIALVIAGLGIALTPGITSVSLTPDLIVIVFLPALLFEASYNLSFAQLRQSFRFIATLAFVGVLASALLVAVVLVVVGGLSWQTALLFGSIVSATDPVSVVATFRKLGTPHRLNTIVEGESLFNDGAALVLFNLLVAVVVSQNFSLSDSLVQFGKVAIGGLLLGTAIGYLGYVVISRLNEHLTETLITLIVAYGTFLAAEVLELSPALAVVAAGLIVGNVGQEKGMSPSSRIAVGLSWELIGFVANSLIFLLVGLQLHALPSFDLLAIGGITILGIIATTLGRTVVVVAFSAVTNLLRPSSAIPFKWQVVMIWGGLRGAISLALALSLPLTLDDGSVFGDRNKLLVMTFGLILFTLVVQGLTLEPLVKRFRLGRISSERQTQYELLRGELVAVRAAYQEAENLRQRGLLGGVACDNIQRDYTEREQVVVARLGQLQLEDGTIAQRLQEAVEEHLLQIEKDAIRTLQIQGIISEESLSELWSAIDDKISRAEESV